LLYPGSKVLEKLNVDFQEYQPYETIGTDHLCLTAYPVIHTEAAIPHGLRIRLENRIISYSGDTEWTENLVKLSEDADLFICECNFFALQVKGHLNYHLLKEKVKNLACKQILLTHFGTEMLDNLDKVGLKCASDGMMIEL
jgi:ribonuclease BN (tRNA processing enzyme)